MSLLLPDSGLLFWMLLSFGVVFVVLAKYGFPVITKMVEGRKTYIDQSLEVAREANAQLSKLYYCKLLRQVWELVNWVQPLVLVWLLLVLV